MRAPLVSRNPVSFVMGANPTSRYVPRRRQELRVAALLEALAVDGFELDGRVLEVEVVGEAGAQLVEHGGRIGRRLDHDVRGDDVLARRQRPGVEVVDVDDARRPAADGSAPRPRSTPRGVAWSRTSVASRSRLHVRGTIRSAISTEAIVSIGVQPVTRMTSPATRTATEPKQVAHHLQVGAAKVETALSAGVQEPDRRRRSPPARLRAMASIGTASTSGDRSDALKRLDQDDRAPPPAGSRR